MNFERDEIDRLLLLWGRGNIEARDRLFELAIHELRRIATHLLRREPRDLTLQEDDLVNEAVLRLLRDPPPWRNPAHFYTVAGIAMRHALVDHARKRRGAIRNVGWNRIILRPAAKRPDQPFSVEAQIVDLLSLNEALEHLEQTRPELAQIALHVYLLGETLAETAERLEISSKVAVQRLYRARSLLREHFTQLETYIKPAPISVVQRLTSQSNQQKVQIELTIPTDYHSFTAEDQHRIIAQLQEWLDHTGEIRVIRIVPGSTKLTIEITPQQAEQFLWLYHRGNTSRVKY